MTRRPESRSGKRRARANPAGLKAALEPFLPRKRSSCWSFVVRLKWTSCEPRSVLRWGQRERAAPGHKASSPKLPRTDRTSSADPLTPKTCRVIVAESKIFQENGVKQLLSDPSSCSSWQKVSDQLAALAVAEVKALLKTVLSQ